MVGYGQFDMQLLANQSILVTHTILVKPFVAHFVATIYDTQMKTHH
jgi:hypothetical protein